MSAIDLRFITGMKFYKDELETLNNMTFIYDANWSANNNPKPTFPVCFFHVKSNGQHESMSSEISQKQMLFYNSSADTNDSDASTGVDKDSGLLNVVADNIVIKPKIYRLDVIIPFHNLTLLDQSFVHNTFTAQAMASALINKTIKSAVKEKMGDKDYATLKQVDKDISSVATLSEPYLNFVKALLTTLLSTDYSSDIGFIDDYISNVTGHSDFNKESLETMWRMRHILKMKVWNSWQYKYVSIVDIDITKDGTEDGVYEATLTLQEMPIVTMYAKRKSAMAVFERKNPLLEKRGTTAIRVLDNAGGILGK